MEIENPGRLPFDLTPETIKSSHASYPYNPLIAEVLFKASFLESWGSGVSRMVDACNAQGVPEPEYEVAGGFVRIVFRRAMGKTTGTIVESSLEGMELAWSWQGVGKELGVDYSILERIGRFCQEARSLSEIAEHLGFGDRYKMKKKYIDPILGKYIEMTIPETPNSKLQQYILTEAGRNLM